MFEHKLKEKLMNETQMARPPNGSPAPHIQQAAPDIAAMLSSRAMEVAAPWVNTFAVQQAAPATVRLVFGDQNMALAGSAPVVRGVFIMPLEMFSQLAALGGDAVLKMRQYDENLRLLMEKQRAEAAAQQPLAS